MEFKCVNILNENTACVPALVSSESLETTDRRAPVTTCIYHSQVLRFHIQQPVAYGCETYMGNPLRPKRIQFVLF
jgi:hypothetical protein